MPKRKIEIFKYQKSINVHGTSLIYNKSRKITGTLPLTEELDEIFGNNLKIYLQGHYRHQDGVIEIEDIVEDQDW